MSRKYLFKNNLNSDNNYIKTYSSSPGKNTNRSKNSGPRFNTIDTNAKFTNEKLINNLKFFNYSKLKEILKNSNSMLFPSKSNKNMKKSESTISKRINIFIKNSSNNPKRNKKKDYIQLNSLFTLPSIDRQMSRYNSIKTMGSFQNGNLIDFNTAYSIENKEKIKNMIKRGKLRLNFLNEEKLSIDKLKKNNKYDNIYSFMKFKYYEDVNERLEKKLRDEEFIDRGVKDKIIKMGKVGVFWKNVMEYCTPLLFEEKYKNIKKRLMKSLNQEEKMNINYNNNNNKVNKNFLYTSMFRTKIIHYQRKIKNNILNL